MAASLSESFVRRVAFARYVFRLGEQQAQSPPPGNAAALLSLQDAIELLLLAACEHRGVHLKERATFYDYLAGLEKAYEEPVPFATAAQRLNKARVGLKHAGIMPAAGDVPAFAADTGDFLRANALKALGLDFDAVSLWQLISDSEVRRRVSEAEYRMRQQQYGICVDLCMLAMHRLRRIHDPHERYSQREGWSQSARETLGRWEHGLSTLFLRSGRHQGADEELRKEFSEFTRDVCRAVRTLSQQVDAASLGLHWPSYRRFRGIGTVESMADGSRLILGTLKADTREEARFALDFVTDSALQLQSATQLVAGLNADENEPALLQEEQKRHKSGQLRTLQVVQLDKALFEYRELNEGRLSRVHTFADAEHARARLQQGLAQGAVDGWTQQGVAESGSQGALGTSGSPGA